MDVSFSRPISRTTAKPNVAVGPGVNRSCENGMRNSASQPSAVARDADVPHGVPAVVVVGVVEPVAILLDAGRVDGELVRGAAIVKRIDEDAEPVARRVVVAPREIGDDLVRLGIERSHPHVERRRIVGDAKLGPLARLGPLFRLTLDKRRHRHERLPSLVGEGHALPRARAASEPAPTSMAASPRCPGGLPGRGVESISDASEKRRRGSGLPLAERQTSSDLDESTADLVCSIVARGLHDVNRY